MSVAGKSPTDVKRRSRIAVIGLRGMPRVIGGIEAHCALLYPALAESDDTLSIEVLARSGYSQGTRVLRDNLAVRTVWAPGRGAAETLIHTPIAIVAAARLGCGVVHLHGIGPAFFAPMARLLGMRVIVTHHATDFRRPKWSAPGRLFLRAGEAIAARFADHIVCVSQALEDDFLARHPVAASRSLVIRHGVALADYTQSSAQTLFHDLELERGKYFLAVGRLEETKRFDDLLDAHAATGSPFPLVIVGSTYGPSDYAQGLRQRADANVRFVGYRHGAELSALYDGAAMLLHPSAMEGFGLVVLEAMTSGAPVALSDIPVHREFGLPEDSFFAVGDVRAITRIMDATPARLENGPPGDVPERESCILLMVSEHQRVFHDIIGA